MKIQKLIIITVLVIINCTAFAQSKKVKKADESFKAGEYFRANEQYMEVYPKLTEKKLKAEVAFKMGECNRRMNLPVKAEKWFSKAVANKYNNPLANLYYGEALKMNGKYEEALAEFQKYQDLVPEDARGANGVQSCKAVIEWSKSPTRYVVENVKDINSKQSDFSPAYGANGSELYFTSAREGTVGRKVNGVSGFNFADIFFTKMDKKGKWSVPVPVEGELNSPFDDGSGCLSKDGSTMYYTICKMEQGKDLGSQILVSQKQDDKWGAPKVVEITKDSSIIVAQPTISADGKTLYFNSNMKGSLGGTDIWKVERSSENADWGKPTNLGPQINTVDDEKFPFIREDGTLYFASNGRVGMGGLDIFKAVKDKGGDWKVENMKTPINSSADDFGIIFDGKEDKGFFSSTRADGKGSDDIYSFILQPLVFSIKGLVKNAENGVAIPEAEVKMVGSEGTSLQTLSGNDGSFRFNLKENADYVFTTKKDKFLNGKGNETTKGLTENKVLEILITMVPIVKPIEVENIEYEYNKADLRPESMVSLDALVETLNENPNITIELRSHTDARGENQYNLELSQRRAQSVVDYLISKNIKAARLTPKGYGEAQPAVISKKVAEKYPFLKEGDILNEDFIDHLASKEQKESAHQLNRRTEFQVISTTFKDSDGGIPFGTDGDKKK